MFGHHTKEPIDVAEVGIMFQVLPSATGNALLPTADKRADGTSKYSKSKSIIGARIHMCDFSVFVLLKENRLSNQ
jgi:hypothetical protein